MGSLAATGIPVVAKNSNTYRKMSVIINATDSETDVATNIVTADVARTISSGSIVRDDGSVDYYEDLAWGAYRMGRSTMERVASDVGASRDNMVKLGDNRTVAVVPDSLQPNIPQLGYKHTGDSIQESQSVDDSIVQRIPNSGVYDDGFPL